MANGEMMAMILCGWCAGFKEILLKGDLTGYPIKGVRVVVTDGASHPVDSNEISFRLAAHGGFREAYKNAGVGVIEPVMAVEVVVPLEARGAAVHGLAARRGLIESVEARDEHTTTIRANVPLEQMFGYSAELRGITEGKGEFTMEYAKHDLIPAERQAELAAQVRGHQRTSASAPHDDEERRVC
jgi:elongation factor G